MRQADRRFAVQHQRALGDVLGQIADAFELACDLDRGQRLAQIDRHGLAQRQQLQRLILDLLLQLVDARIAGDGGFGERGVALGDRLDGVGELRLGQPAHLGDGGGQRLELFGEGLHDVIGHVVLLSLPQPA